MKIMDDVDDLIIIIACVNAFVGGYEMTGNKLCKGRARDTIHIHFIAEVPSLLARWGTLEIYRKPIIAIFFYDKQK